jgi:hypothetical protein
MLVATHGRDKLPVNKRPSMPALPIAKLGEVTFAPDWSIFEAIDLEPRAHDQKLLLHTSSGGAEICLFDRTTFACAT